MEVKKSKIFKNIFSNHQKYGWFECYTPFEEGKVMVDKLCVAERRIRILNFLMMQKQATIRELREEFQLSKNTIVRDIEFISCIAPIYTQRGNGGGIYILPEYRSYKNYLTDAEENFLYSLMPLVSNEEKRILWDIIIRLLKSYALS